MSNPLTVKQFTDYLNSKFPKGLVCPLCREQAWEIRAVNGAIDTVEEAEAVSTKAIGEMWNGDHTPDASPAEDDKMASSCIAVRCGNCGNLIYFDRLFVKGRIHD